MVSNETSYLKLRTPLLGRRIQVVGHAGAGKVSRSVNQPPSNKTSNVSVPVCVFGKTCRGNSGIIVYALIPVVLSIAYLGARCSFGHNFLE